MSSSSDNEGRSDRALPWEDTVIIALRDLQWSKHVTDCRERIRTWTDAPDDESAASVGKQALELLARQPGILLKLDGNAESASGDVLTNPSERFFLLEVKAGESAIKSEKSKFMLKFMKSLEPSTTSGAEVIRLSRLGHHFLFPEVNQTMAPTLGLHTRKVSLTCTPYYDAMVSGSPAGEADSLQRTEAVELFWGRARRGLDLAEMAAYLKVLAEAHSGGGGGSGAKQYPMKVIITGSDGFCWPVADLTAFHHAAYDFQQRATLARDEQNARVAALHKNIQASARRYLAQNKPSAPSTAITLRTSLDLREDEGLTN